MSTTPTSTRRKRPAASRTGRATSATAKASPPARAAKSAKPAKPAKPVKPVKPAKPAKATRPAPANPAPARSKPKAAGAAARPAVKATPKRSARGAPTPGPGSARPDSLHANRTPARGRSATREADEAAAAAPRYQQIARELKAAIVGGQYPVGARLPTEAELCDTFGISRFTAREAVRLLATAGLVTRRQRAGTVVIALPGEARYTPTLASLNDLQQYARDTEMRVVYVGRIALDRAHARAFGAEPGAEWIHAIGIRHETATAGAPRAAGARASRAGRVRPGDGRPFCVVRVYLNPLLAGIESRLRTRRVTIYSIIENEFGHAIERVEQDLTGTLLGAEDAAHLEATPGAAALLIVRRYYDTAGVLLQVAENVHPADRFTFRMQLRK